MHLLLQAGAVRYTLSLPEPLQLALKGRWMAAKYLSQISTCNTDLKRSSFSRLSPCSSSLSVSASVETGVLSAVHGRACPVRDDQLLRLHGLLDG